MRSSLLLYMHITPSLFDSSSISVALSCILYAINSVCSNQRRALRSVVKYASASQISSGYRTSKFFAVPAQLKIAASFGRSSKFGFLFVAVVLMATYSDICRKHCCCCGVVHFLPLVSFAKLMAIAGCLTTFSHGLRAVAAPVEVISMSPSMQMPCSMLFVCCVLLNIVERWCDVK